MSSLAKYMLKRFVQKGRNWARRDWHNTLPPKIVTFLGKLMKHAVLVDNWMSAKGILMVSRCRCCANPAVENMGHLFLHSEIARVVWLCFGTIFRLPYCFQSITQAIKTWLPLQGKLSLFSHAINTGLPLPFFGNFGLLIGMR